MRRLVFRSQRLSPETRHRCLTSLVGNDLLPHPAPAVYPKRKGPGFPRPCLLFLSLAMPDRAYTRQARHQSSSPSHLRP